MNVFLIVIKRKHAQFAQNVEACLCVKTLCRDDEAVRENARSVKERPDMCSEVAILRLGR